MARYDPKAKKGYTKIASTPFVKHNEKNDAHYSIPVQTYRLDRIANNKKNQKIRFAVFNTNDVIVNKVEVSVNELLEEESFPAEEGAMVVFSDFELYDRPTFFDYLKSSWHI